MKMFERMGPRFHLRAVVVSREASWSYVPGSRSRCSIEVPFPLGFRSYSSQAASLDPAVPFCGVGARTELCANGTLMAWGDLALA